MSTVEPRTYFMPPKLGEGHRGGWHVIGDLLQRLGMDGDISGTSGRPARTFFYSLGMAAAVVGVVNVENILSGLGMHYGHSLLWPSIDEGSSFFTFVLFFWIIWLGWYLAPLSVRPRRKLLLHIPLMLAFSFTHVGGFLVLRTLFYRLAGSHYMNGGLLSRFLYEFRKDAFAYALFFAGITLVDHLLRQRPSPASPPLTFDIRDGAKLFRVKFDEILAVTSAGNYVEFLLRDGRRLLMRSALSTLESELVPRGFLRTHRSWLINTTQVTAIKPEGSGDYEIELGGLTVPLSRRFPNALIALRRG